MGLLDKIVNPEKIIDEKALVDAAIDGLRELLATGIEITATVGGVEVKATIKTA